LALFSASSHSRAFSAQCSAAVNPRETVPIGQTREKSRIELPVVRRRTRQAGDLAEGGN
jgi:hypothetical protein